MNTEHEAVGNPATPTPPVPTVPVRDPYTVERELGDEQEKVQLYEELVEDAADTLNGVDTAIDAALDAFGDDESDEDDRAFALADLREASACVTAVIQSLSYGI